MSDFRPAISWTAAEIEKDRQDRLRQPLADRERSDAELLANYGPGSFGCHEALHTASIIMEMVDERLCGHPAILANPDWYRLASEAHTALYNLYQAIGERHLGGELSVGVPDS